MKKLCLLPLLLLLLLFSCKKDKPEYIDYTVLTEQRILEISEQNSISAEDIASLERLLEKVSNTTAKSRLGGMLDGVRHIKDIIPGIAELRTNPALNFQDKYKELESKLRLVSELLPRKAKLQQALEEAKANYNTEEYEYPDDIVPQLTAFLKENYRISPVAGKPKRFLRADIEKVDSLVLYNISTTTIKTFKALRHLTTNIDEPVVDLNHLVYLESLNVYYPKELKIGQCSKLKQLTVRAGTDGHSVLDLTGSNDLLETVAFTTSVFYNPIKEIILPGKQHLQRVLVQGVLNKLQRLVVEAGGSAVSEDGISFGIAVVEQVKLSGFNGIGIRSALQSPNFTKIKDLTMNLPEATLLGITNCELPKSMNIAQLQKLKELQLGDVSISETTNGTSYENWLPFLGKVNAETLESFAFLNLTTYTNKTVDLGKFKKLNYIQLPVTNIQGSQVLDKLIINRAIQQAGYTFSQVTPPDWIDRKVEIVAVD